MRKILDEKMFKVKSDIDLTEQDKHILQFCGAILGQFGDVLEDREKVVCQSLLEGRSKKWVADTLYISTEHVRQIFIKSIKKISKAYEDLVQRVEDITKENIELKHRNFVLENEVMKAQMKERVEELLGREHSLCFNAIRLLDVPVRLLPLSARVINVLETANVLTFKEIPQMTTEQLYRVRNCGSKTIFDINKYLDHFSLKLGMQHEEVIAKLAELSDEDISTDNFGSYKACKGATVVIKDIPTEEKLENLTLSQFCAEMGRGKKSKKKWGSKVKRILLENHIDTLEKFLAMKPSEFEALKGVGPTTLKYARMAFDYFGLVWCEAPVEN